jgi:ribbon-helix-helix protein
MLRCHFLITEDQSKALKERSLQTGVPQSEQIRRAINLVLFADKQSKRQRKQAQHSEQEQQFSFGA